MNNELEGTLTSIINDDVCINGRQAADLISVVQVLLNNKWYVCVWFISYIHLQRGGWHTPHFFETHKG